MKTNDLRFKATKTGINYGGTEADIIVNIRLNDECKNGHQDFAITGDIYKTGKRTNSAYIGGGCIHEEIEKFFPEYKPFINLHLCDAKGIPMYAIENGFYHLTNGFNSKSTGKAFKNEFCAYYRITSDQFDVLSKSENKLEYGILLKELGILQQWEIEANEAIKLLESLTGNEFINDSVKSQYNAPTPEQIEEFKHRKAEGYYLPEAKQQRIKEAREQAKAKRFKAIEDKLKEEIKKETTKADIKLFILKRFDQLHDKGRGFNNDFMFDNFIYYTYTNTVKFNWHDGSYYKILSDVEFKMFCNSINEADFNKLPTGISFECNGVVYTRS